MFKYRSIKKYGSKLLPTLEKRFGYQDFYSASQIRATVYQKNLNPQYLPLGYILFLESRELSHIMAVEFPTINITEYKNEMLSYLESKSYQGYLSVLHQY